MIDRGALVEGTADFHMQARVAQRQTMLLAFFCPIVPSLPYYSVSSVAISRLFPIPGRLANCPWRIQIRVRALVQATECPRALTDLTLHRVSDLPSIPATATIYEQRTRALDSSFCASSLSLFVTHTFSHSFYDVVITA